jgi:hypothetical protein
MNEGAAKITSGLEAGLDDPCDYAAGCESVFPPEIPLMRVRYTGASKSSQGGPFSGFGW